MKLSEIKNKLRELKKISFQLPNGALVPSHFHVTEVGKITKHFVDCGGTERNEEVANFQLWNANDYNHRLHPEKLLGIIELSERILGIGDLEIEVEYQADTIGKFGLDFNGSNFVLTSKQTNCLAQDQCGIPSEKLKIQRKELDDEPCCSPDGNCC
ncbi:hypothetical protein SAMN05444396_110117 [Flavobacterium segetis]|uniref:Uncharacterized protein n=1 Tax=Flavobacterium segetis TaxID=271157 RepID=A0A1M5JEF9_9FLAO|nr:DUF6428 family protein [Flavobacterium segetis]SHG38962.1 hypothetical protein SAMN05444396_110117 [Flavobacterium segetis]